jgi:hypothetical protein
VGSPFAKVKLGGGEPLLFLHPYDPATNARTRVHPGKRFAADGVTAYAAGSWFAPETVQVKSARDLHQVLTTAAFEGTAFVVRAIAAHKGKFVRRTKNPRGSCPAGLREHRLRWAAWDCDKWPNVWKLDPRTHGRELIARLRATLGAEFVDAEGTLQWSSSCCLGVPAGQPPDTVSFRIWTWGGTAMGEAELRDLAKRLDGRVRTALGIPGYAGYLVDPKVADLQQPIYVANPVFDGVQDPMGGRRWVWLTGSQECLCLYAEDLPPPTSRTAWTRPEGNPVAAQRDRPTPKPRSTTVAAPGQPVPLAAASREIAAAREALAARGMEAFRDACNGFGMARVALEMAALAHRRGGLVEGERDESATMIASAIVRSLPPDGRTDERVRAEVRAVLRLCVSEDWIMEEWEGKAKDCSVLQRFRVASQMAAARTLKRRNDPRYTYTLKRLSEEWGATRNEVLELSLRSLAPSALRRIVDRRAAGAVDREAYLLASRQGAVDVARLVTRGMGLRAISRELEMPISKVRRLMPLSSEQVAAATPMDAPGSPVAGKSDANGLEPTLERMAA